MSEQQNGNGYPKVICEKCHVPMDVIGIGSASGRLKYHCSKCGAERWGKNLAAMQLGSLGGKARAEALTPEQRKEQSIKGAKARAASMTAEERSEQSTRAASARWSKEKNSLR